MDEPRVQQNRHDRRALASHARRNGEQPASFPPKTPGVIYRAAHRLGGRWMRDLATHYPRLSMAQHFVLTFAAGAVTAACVILLLTGIYFLSV